MSGIAINFLAGFLAALIGYVIGIRHAVGMCAAQGKDLMDTHDRPSPLKNPESDLLLRQQAATAYGLAWRIELLIKPWKWGRPKVSKSQNG